MYDFYVVPSRLGALLGLTSGGHAKPRTWLSDIDLRWIIGDVIEAPRPAF